MSNDKLDIITPSECRRCATCCRQGGPALHAEDRKIFENGVIESMQLVTVRTGEPAHDPLQNDVLPVVTEFIKVRGQGANWSCIFLEQESDNCRIYRQRPVECRLLFCGDTAPLEEIIGKDLLTRNDLVSEDDPVLGLIDRLEEECSYNKVKEILAGTDRDSQLEFLNDLVRRDLAIRQAFLNHFPDRQREELFLFGRPLFLVLAPYGYKLVENDGGLSLVIIEP